MSAPAQAPDLGRPDAAWHDGPYAAALRTGHGPLFLRRADGWLLPLDVERWCARPDPADHTVLARCDRGPVLDIGCGPGRLVAELAALGRPALGIDVSPAAVSRTVLSGGSALCRSVFDPLPREGSWGTALLMDGNIGIGGDPETLLGRTAALLAPNGTVIAETAPVDIDERVQVHMTDSSAHATGPLFPWARVGPRALRGYARRCGLSTTATWTSQGRTFTELTRGR
ncbi:methyltransferase domain-containing protein [Streptomyces sp. TRM66268-LWL]|uniref:Methyltransferase domain-containing protein n=1 Tax=Streptomyces polyasparticus TaxID=2767826 RepID=A0ABR7S9X1_9ACTN|nr:class I SAM-dependent methyltransferase [Streptomyces polyasparticus]MBC9711934.1 methyltransferase domain-containing protein [Streptomyces polyasparticus]